ncbi:MAG: UPF0179 family protein [Candidatus Helarchaeales archaeon]
MEGIITMLYSKLARVGYQFQHLGEPKECSQCKLYFACIKNLKKGSIYEVIEVRQKTHYCALINDTVKVVKVKELPIETYIEAPTAFEGAIITFHPKECSFEECPYREICFDSRLVKNQKYKILEVLGQEKIECQQGLKLRKVKLKPI